MRIVAGAWRGRPLRAPGGAATRPTSDRARQTLFDMLAHAPWAPPSGLRGLHVLDAFAGTGALGLEALSRGAARASFFETDRAALAALRGNVAALGADAASAVMAADALVPPPAPQPADLVFLDPPYGRDLPARSLPGLIRAGWIVPGTLLVIETARDEDAPGAGDPLAEKRIGAARVTVSRVPGSARPDQEAG